MLKEGPMTQTDPKKYVDRRDEYGKYRIEIRPNGIEAMVVSADDAPESPPE